VRGFWHECRALLRHWFVGGIAISLFTAIGGAVVAAPFGASTGERVEAAILGALLGLAVVALAIPVFALVRMRLRKYRERYGLEWAGRECLDVAHAMADGIPFKGNTNQDFAFLNKETEDRAMRLYVTQLASRVFYAARELEQLDVIDKAERDGLAKAPEGPIDYLVRMDRLSDLGSRLGATQQKR
jgi:hypothetical protein